MAEQQKAKERQNFQIVFRNKLYYQFIKSGNKQQNLCGELIT